MTAPEHPVPTDLLAKFAEYRRTHDRRLRNEIIESQYGFVVQLARRYASRGVPFDDLVQVAQLGMLKAVERFDPRRGSEFAAFARATVVGELKRHFRDATWAVRVPRGAQELHLQLSPTLAALSQELKRAPTLSELADALRCSEDAVLQAMEVGRAYRSASIEGGSSANDTDAPALESRLGRADPGFEATENRVLVAELVAFLPDRERRILELRFYGDMTQSEIAREVGISQMHVSRILARALASLRARVECA